MDCAVNWAVAAVIALIVAAIAPAALVHTIRVGRVYAHSVILRAKMPIIFWWTVSMYVFIDGMLIFFLVVGLIVGEPVCPK